MHLESVENGCDSCSNIGIFPLLSALQTYRVYYYSEFNVNSITDLDTIIFSQNTRIFKNFHPSTRNLCICYLFKKEPLPGVLGNKGTGTFIFWEQGIFSNYFQGTRELLSRLLGTREHRSTFNNIFFLTFRAPKI